LAFDMDSLVLKYGKTRQALIPVLQEVQAAEGYLSEDSVVAVSEGLGLPASEVFGVLTFYAQFRTTPVGRTLIRACRGTACHVRGAAKVREALEEALGIKAGETTPDMEYSLETVACIGACAMAPSMVLGETTHAQLTPEKIAEMFADYTPSKREEQE
jgi:NADH-quinone oxidoreductase E subunit